VELFDEMKGFWAGKTEEGHDRFSVPLRSDEDGMIGRECPSEDCQPRYFKIGLRTDDDESSGEREAGHTSDLSQSDLVCPYCGRLGNMQEFHTQEQIEWVKSMMVRDVHRAFQKVISRAIGPSRPPPPGALFSVRLEYKPGRLPDVRAYAEERLRRTVRCDKCQRSYAVYGISFQCPLCRGGNLALHLDRSCGTVESLIEAGNLIRERGGEEAVQHHLGNALEDVVSLFEGFAKIIFQRALAVQVGEGEARGRVATLRTTFQRLTGAEEQFRSGFGLDPFAGLSTEERDFLEGQFLKRHVITHNLGLVDEKYQERARAWERRGQEIHMDPDEVRRALSLVRATLSRLVAWLETHPLS